MYNKHFGFKRAPFNLTPNSHFYFKSAKHTEALSTLLYAVNERKGFVVITGEIGSGKTTVCRALINQPKLVLADEPTGNLDSRTGHQVMEIMAELSNRRQTTFILATHSAEAASYASRKLAMWDGAIMA